jgi:hypothetical protein
MYKQIGMFFWVLWGYPAIPARIVPVSAMFFMFLTRSVGKKIVKIK